MATVKLTANIQHEIIGSIRQQYDKRLQTAQAAVMNTKSLVQELLKRIYPDDTLELVKTIQEHPILHRCVAYLNSVAISTKHFSFELPVPKGTYPAFSSGGYGSMNQVYRISSGDQIYNEQVEPFMEFKKLCAEYEELVKERDELINQIQILMGKAGTLKRLVVVWPSCLEYVSAETRARHYKKHERSASIIELTELGDDTSIALTKLRLGG